MLGSGCHSSTAMHYIYCLKTSRGKYDVIHHTKSYKYSIKYTGRYMYESSKAVLFVQTFLKIYGISLTPHKWWQLSLSQDIFLFFAARWFITVTSPQCHCVWNQRLPDCFFNSLLRITTSKLRVIGSFWGAAVAHWWFPTQRSSNVERVSMDSAYKGQTTRKAFPCYDASWNLPCRTSYRMINIRITTIVR